MFPKAQPLVWGKTAGKHGGNKRSPATLHCSTCSHMASVARGKSETHKCTSSILRALPLPATFGCISLIRIAIFHCKENCLELGFCKDARRINMQAQVQWHTWYYTPGCPVSATLISWFCHLLLQSLLTSHSKQLFGQWFKKLNLKRIRC